MGILFVFIFVIGGTIGGESAGYWTMSSNSEYVSEVLFVDGSGKVYSNGFANSYGVRAVVVVDK